MIAQIFDALTRLDGLFNLPQETVAILINLLFFSLKEHHLQSWRTERTTEALFHRQRKQNLQQNVSIKITMDCT